MSKLNSILGLQQKNEIIEKISLDLISPNPFQPRQFFDNENLEELSLSIQQYGVLQPILVRKISSKEYQLIAGERRFRASKIAGIAEIPAIVKNMSDHQVAEIAIIENLQRENLNYFEEAEGFRLLIDQFKLTQEDVAKKVGKSQSMVANKLRLLKLPLTVRKQISTEILTERHVRAILKLKNENDQLLILDKIYQDNLNVKQTEILINKIIEKNDQLPATPPIDDLKKIVKTRDYRLYQNTLKKSLESIEFGGAKTDYSETFFEDHLEVVIKIYK